MQIREKNADINYKGVLLWGEKYYHMHTNLQKYLGIGD